MKRELKPQDLSSRLAGPSPHCRAYPDEKGIETPSLDRPKIIILPLQSLSRWKGNWNRIPKSTSIKTSMHCRAYPDEKGIETTSWNTLIQYMLCVLQSLSRWKGNWNSVWILRYRKRHLRIAEPIPMKRELKHSRRVPHSRFRFGLQSLSRWKGNWNGTCCPEPSCDYRNCRAYPDEKGIETTHSAWIRTGAISSLQSLSRWKGNWNPSRSFRIFRTFLNCRAYPDEKGIETRIRIDDIQLDNALQSLSRWKGNWNRLLVLFLSGVAPKLQSLSRWKGNWNLIAARVPYHLYGLIAEPIPMKRELKPKWPTANSLTQWNCRAYPDEKGIETRWQDLWHSSQQPNCRAYPDEKGIETENATCR